MKAVTINRPDDWHVHFRDESVLKDTVNATAKHFGRALVMPNLQPPLTSLAAILAYRQRIVDAILPTHDFEPVMTFYLNEQVDLDELVLTKKYPFIVGAKLYPAGATTHAETGPESIKKLYPWFALLQENDLVLQVHGEENKGDIFDRESRFIEDQLVPLRENFPRLRIVLEHISTQKAVDFILSSAGDKLAATVTPHHLLYNRNHLLAQGIRPHFYCLPILKRQSDQQAIQAALMKGDRRFFAGTDSAPHAVAQKESACGCAGIYSAPYALGFYATFFDKADVMDKMDAFLSEWGADFYQLPRSTSSVVLIKKTQLIPEKLAFGSNTVVPLAAGESLAWSVHD